MLLWLLAFVFSINAEPKPQGGISGHLMNILQNIHSNSKQHIKIEIDTENTKDIHTEITYLDFTNLPASVLSILGSHKSDFVTFGKTYAKKISRSNGDKAATNFVSNNGYLKDLLKKNLYYKVGMHPYMDLDEEETLALAALKSAKRFVKKQENTRKRRDDEEESSDDELPESFDWRDKDVVPEVKNQGSCGSCWAFATAACMEIQYARENNEIIDLSEQQMTCVYPNKKTICKGGFPSVAFNHYMDDGIGLESDSPYDPSGDLRCYSFKQRLSVSSVTDLLPFDMDTVKRAIVNDGPIAVGMYINWNFMYYDGGIFDTSCEDLSGLGGHAMVITGYGVEDDYPYWIVRNSWGTSWEKMAMLG
ncbi:unnamed protein product, partial [Mesorhabditis belari]|uniref:Peptidase C1A papain C-terminal domain-containing protein n=1 Tax=Mesorhabditis belari TaxID=2138241 RepID=A0AAF3F529_9BILA